jgi:hypothetical protein
MIAVQVEELIVMHVEKIQDPAFVQLTIHQTGVHHVKEILALVQIHHQDAKKIHVMVQIHHQDAMAMAAVAVAVAVAVLTVTMMMTAVVAEVEAAAVVVRNHVQILRRIAAALNIIGVVTILAIISCPKIL